MVGVLLARIGTGKVLPGAFLRNFHVRITEYVCSYVLNWNHWKKHFSLFQVA